MNKLLYFIGVLLCLLLISGCGKTPTPKDDLSKDSKPSQVKIVEYGDFKCSYCKKVEETVMPKLIAKYEKNSKVDYEFVNMAFLGEDAIIASRAGHAVQQVSPDAYLTYQKLMFKQQPKSEENWITEQLVDEQIDQLSLTQEEKSKIKSLYKTKNSKAWKAAENDQQRYKKNHIKQAPTVFINGTQIDDPYHFESYEKVIDQKLKELKS